jgi:hypothetical protein
MTTAQRRHRDAQQIIHKLSENADSGLGPGGPHGVIGALNAQREVDAPRFHCR